MRSFSKAWGLAGLRVGYAIGGPGSEELLAELEPDLGVSEVSQAGALEALRACSEIVSRRVAAIARERAAVTEGLRERGFDVTDSQANFVWAAHPAVDGGELSARLARAGILVAGRRRAGRAPARAHRPARLARERTPARGARQVAVGGLMRSPSAHAPMAGVRMRTPGEAACGFSTERRMRRSARPHMCGLG